MIGQLAAMITAGPTAELVNVSSAALPLDGTLDRFEGVFVGSLDIPGSLSLDELEELLGAGVLDGPYIDPASRARVVAFQTWVNATDEQVLVRPEDGVVLSIDHGDCFTEELLDIIETQGREVDSAIAELRRLLANDD